MAEQFLGVYTQPFVGSQGFSSKQEPGLLAVQFTSVVDPQAKVTGSQVVFLQTSLVQTQFLSHPAVGISLH
jgi:hypothetical protein